MNPNSPLWKIGNETKGSVLRQKLYKAWKSVADDILYRGLIGAKSKIQEAEKRLQAELLELGYKVESTSWTGSILESLAIRIFDGEDERKISQSIQELLERSVKVTHLEGEFQKLADEMCQAAENFIAQLGSDGRPRATSDVDMDGASVKIMIPVYLDNKETSFYYDFEKVMGTVVDRFAAKHGLHPRETSSDSDDRNLLYTCYFAD